MQTAPIIQWSEPVAQFLGFVGSFIATGAVGFRYAVVRDRLTRGEAAEQTVYGDATQRAAAIGLLGAVIQGVLLVMELPGAAARAHIPVAQLVMTDVQTAAQCMLLVAAIVGLTLAAVRRWSGWAIAAVGIIAAPLVEIFSGQWSKLVNPIHLLMGGLWLGTLFVLVVAGLATVLGDEASRERRGAIAADMVNGFSPLALTCGALLVLSGLVTAWQHLNPLSSLWTTPYGYALLIKLSIVAVVFGLGAWNWRRQRPRLGSEDGAIAIRRSSSRELAAATLVLVVTAILVSLPSPRPPRPPGTGAPPNAPRERSTSDDGAAIATPANRPYEELTSYRGVLATTITAQESPITFGGQTWSAMLYNGVYLPPVLRLQPGDSLKLHLINQLPADQQTNIHYHGTATSPKPPSDYVLSTIGASATYDYALYFPGNHDRGLFWYHPHPHGQSEKQVQDGMSGLLIVEGFLETYYPWLHDVPERLLMLKDPEPPGRPNSAGHAKTINGEVSTTFTIRPGELQFWRIGNIGADAYFNLKIDGHRVWLLASDANGLRKPLLVDSLYLPPGARAEVLIEGGAPGRHAIRHAAVNTGPAGDPNPAAPLGTLIVQGPRVDRTADVARLRAMPDIPAIVKEITDVRAVPVTRRRTFAFSETPDGNTFFINGRQFDMRSVNTRVKVGDVEGWTLINTTKEWHAFHIHQIDFLVTEINGVPQPGHSLHDTVNLPFAVSGHPGIVKVIIPFTDPNIVGRFVYHCHILEHEDGGMMQIIQVDPATGAAATVAAKPSSSSHPH